MWEMKLIWLPGLWMVFVVFMCDHKLLFKTNFLKMPTSDGVRRDWWRHDQAEGQKLRGEWDKMNIVTVGVLIYTSLTWTYSHSIDVSSGCHITWHLWHMLVQFWNDEPFSLHCSSTNFQCRTFSVQNRVDETWKVGRKVGRKSGSKKWFKKVG